MRMRNAHVWNEYTFYSLLLLFAAGAWPHFIHYMQRSLRLQKPQLQPAPVSHRL